MACETEAQSLSFETLMILTAPQFADKSAQAWHWPEQELLNTVVTGTIVSSDDVAE